MIKVVIVEEKHGKITEFVLNGHAGFAESGSDIVCAAVSMLVLNTINSIEQFTNAKYKMTENEEEGYIRFSLQQGDSASDVLLKALKLGLESVQGEFSDYLKISIRREP